MRVLIVFLYHLNDFRINELKSIISLFNLNISLETETYQEDNVYLLIDVVNISDVHLLASRCILIRYFIQIIGFSHDFDHLIENLQVAEIKNIMKSNEDSAKVTIYGFECKIKQEDRISMIHRIFSCLKINHVSLNSPDIEFMLSYNPKISQNCKNLTYIFGVILDKGKTKLQSQFTINKRPFVGSTTLDPTLSFLMANQAQIAPGDFIYDPYVGTASILLGASYFGAFTVGSDIHNDLLYGKTKPSVRSKKYRERDENIAKNFRFYNLNRYYIGCTVANISEFYFNKYNLFDAIITDPPYGIRESSKNTEGGNVLLSDTIESLFDFSAKYIKKGGYLVYWLPTNTESMKEINIPQHPLFDLISTSVQKLQTRSSRVLITMRKNSSFENTLQESFKLTAEERLKHDQYRNVYFNIN